MYMAGNRANLTPKQENFCNYYLETGNASEAYRKAYSCERMKDDTINRNAFSLLNSNKIATRVQLIQNELKKTSDIKKEAILEELSCIAFSDIRDYVFFDGTNIKFKPFDELTDRQAKAIEGIKYTKEGIELKLHGKSWTIDRICKILGFDAAIKQDINLGLPFSDLMKKVSERKAKTK